MGISARKTAAIRKAADSDATDADFPERDDSWQYPTADDIGHRGVTSRYTDIASVSLDEANVPAKLHHLIPYAKYWCIGDDIERGNLMWLTPPEELSEFVAAVWPLCSEINDWCRCHYGEVPIPNEVVVFGMMTEAATEAVAYFTDEPTDTQ